MPGIFDALPGIEVPVGSIGLGLEQMWDGVASSGKPSPEGDKSKATQVNFVLHLGLLTDAEDAARQFDVAVRFSRRYPCRVVVLCPLKDEGTPLEMRAKVYGECTLGKSKDDTRCCEFVMLSYSRSARAFLENEVSISIYYWAHRFSRAANLAEYTYLLTNARRVIFDSASTPDDAEGYPWPRPENVRDLAYARLLPVRQAIGQFLGRYPAAALGVGLRSIELRHGAGVAPEARVLFKWVRGRLADCGASGQAERVLQPSDLPPRSFELAFAYVDGRSFVWKADLDTSHAQFDADFGNGRTVMTATASLLSQEDALSEAMFF